MDNKKFGCYLRLSAFLILLIAELHVTEWKISDLILNTLSNPFWLGIVILIIAYLDHLEFIDLGIKNYDLIYIALSIFIIAKIKSQHYHCKNLKNIWGLKNG